MAVIARDERGIALILCLLALVLLSALGAGLLMATDTEVLIAANFRRAYEARAAAAAVTERVIHELNLTSDWTAVLNGALRSDFFDGPPGLRQLGDGSTVDLSRVINLANCDSVSPCSSTQLDAIRAERPWGANNPRWTRFGSGPIADILPDGAVISGCYGLVLIGDDPSENDANPLADGLDTANPGRGIIMLRGEAFCSRGVRRAVDVVLKQDPLGIRVLSWRDVDRLDGP